MRVAIDCTAASQGAGIGRYTRELVQALLKLGAEHDYRLLTAHEGKAPFFASDGQNGATVRWVRAPFSRRGLDLLWHRARLPVPAELFTGRVDLFHGTDYLLPPLRRARGVVTVHDLSFLLLPETADPRLVRFLSSALPRSLEHATLVLVDSECTRQDLFRLFGLTEQRVVVVPAGVSPRFRRIVEASELQRVRQRYRLPETFLLFLGTLEPRKNLERLVEAYRLLRREEGVTLPLVLAGGRGWLEERFFQRIADLELEGAVLTPGFIAEPDLPALLSLATLFVYPSLYEGFGLPPLEAMACGVAVVAGRSGALPEVLGEGALLVEPTDVHALAEAMARLLRDQGLRAHLEELGPQRAGRYTWEAAARQLLAAYDQAASLP